MGQEERFEDSKRFLQSLGFDDVSHSRRTLFHHLVSTGNLLREWDCPEDVCLAGMFHAVYGTESFRYQNGVLPSRGPVQAVIGPVAERIAWLFGISTGKSLWQQFTFLSDPGNKQSHRVLNTGPRVRSCRAASRNC